MPLPENGPPGYGSGRLIGGLQIACQDDCHTDSVSQLPYVYVCPRDSIPKTLLPPHNKYAYYRGLHSNLYNLKSLRMPMQTCVYEHHSGMHSYACNGLQLANSLCQFAPYFAPVDALLVVWLAWCVVWAYCFSLTVCIPAAAAWLMQVYWAPVGLPA